MGTVFSSLKKQFLHETVALIVIQSWFLSNIYILKLVKTKH